MALLDTTRFVERIGFFDGQRLEAADLSVIDDFNREMRWLHNKSLHQPGVGNGYAVAGKRGDREITVGPGYAIDSRGREIVMTEDLVLSVPPVAGGGSGSSACFDLTIAYPDDTSLDVVETRESDCDARGATRRLEQPKFCWVQLARTGDDYRPALASHAKDILQGISIVLARVCIANCSIDTLTIAQRRNAKAPRQPYVAAGRAAVKWKVATLAQQAGDSSPASAVGPSTLAIPLEADVDTSEARFVTKPLYQARVEGPRVKKMEDQYYVFEVLVNIPTERTTSTSFTVEIILLPRLIGTATSVEVAVDTELEKLLKQISDWKVVWVGVEG